MKVFISWSGTPSKLIAAALYDWLPQVIQEVQPFYSDESIEAGSSWMDEVTDELKGSLGIICLTPNNLSAPWLYFEAGALSKALLDAKVRVMPLLHGLDFSDVGPPLSRFNMIKLDPDGLRKMCTALNNAAASPLPPARLSKAVDAFLPELEAVVSGLPASDALETHRPDRVLLEEILDAVRDMQRARRSNIDVELAMDPGNALQRNGVPVSTLVKWIKATGATGQMDSETMKNFFAWAVEHPDGA